MITINIQCGCGQYYEFEVEPVDGRMPSTVACPTCGLDGTAAANEFLSRSAPAEPAVAPAPAGGLHLHTAAPAAERKGPRRFPGQLDRSQAQHEARAKILWGDSPEGVVAFLTVQGFARAEAREIVDELFGERAVTIRINAIRNIVVGSLLVCVPVGSWFYFMHIGVIYMRIFGLTVVGGFYGLWLLVKGTHMFIAPKSQAGHAADE